MVLVTQELEMLDGWISPDLLGKNYSRPEVPGTQVFQVDPSPTYPSGKQKTKDTPRPGQTLLGIIDVIISDHSWAWFPTLRFFLLYIFPPKVLERWELSVVVAQLASPLFVVSSKGRDLTCFFFTTSILLRTVRYELHNALIRLPNAIQASTPETDVLKLNLQIPLQRVCGSSPFGKCLAPDEVMSIHSSWKDEERSHPAQLFCTSMC